MTPDEADGAGEAGGASRPDDPAGVALVLVSHSSDLARGTAELAGQMAPGVLIVAAGGTDHGLGTDFERVQAALESAVADDRQAVVLTDLGSAVLTTEAVLELVDPEVAERVRLADAPFVEGAVAAAVTAHGGADAAAVAAAAVHAGALFASDAASSQEADDGALRVTRTLLNPMGLHARPAAVVARMLADYDAKVTVNGVNAASVLELMKLGATQGATLTIAADGPQAQAALDALTEAIDAGFGEI
ncbi:dihydroxyacetone kinase phosphoryl donor subunit DhaM [Cellulomonas composti]|uniref:Phosphocarrier protein HPr n=1 Tax=Cellulomonas composti TaxID=266130 RepID=A0A511J8R4_9CELL|nr:dihydroxyacetone kinase phosphoryl donor subunit DhaM [Cellulomonas composti]GEL94382.1 PTS sugar transporter subunit IIA [Cellulomonas composti]